MQLPLLLYCCCCCSSCCCSSLYAEWQNCCWFIESDSIKCFLSLHLNTNDLYCKFMYSLAVLSHLRPRLAYTTSSVITGMRGAKGSVRPPRRSPPCTKYMYSSFIKHGYIRYVADCILFLVRINLPTQQSSWSTINTHVTQLAKLSVNHSRSKSQLTRL